MLLMSARKAEFAEFSPETGAFETFQRDSGEAQNLWSQISGSYDLVENSRVLFFRAEDGGLVLMVDDRKFLTGDETAAENFKLSKNIIKDHFRPRNRFRLIDNGEVLLEFDYTREDVRLRGMWFDPTPFREPEDDDLMLFIANVINDKSRREIIWRGV